MEQTQESNERLQEQLDTYKQKYDQCTEQISHLESTFSKLQEQLAESRTKVCKQDWYIQYSNNISFRFLIFWLAQLIYNYDKLFQEKEKEDIMERLKTELDKVDGELNEKSGELSHAEDVVEQLTSELTNTQDELTKTLEKVTQFEVSITSLKDKLNQTQTEVRMILMRFTNH